MMLGVSCDQISDTLRGVLKKVPDFLKVSGFDVATNGYQRRLFHKAKNFCHKGRQDFTI